MIKTISHIESFIVGTKEPSLSTGGLVVRAPKFMKCFRATIIINNVGTASRLFISTVPTTIEENCLILSSYYDTNTQVAPGTNTTFFSSNKLVLDRRGVGYMEDELYLYATDANVQILWEGIKEN
jgi:hypothetical protein